LKTSSEIKIIYFIFRIESLSGIYLPGEEDGMSMKKIWILLLLVPAGWLPASGQISFSEARMRDKMLNEGISLMIDGSYQMAEAKLSECLAMDSTYAPAYVQRSRIYIEWGDETDAFRDLDLALKYNPRLGEAYFYKGYLLYGNDSTGLDATLFDEAITNGFTEPWAYYFRALTRIREGRNGMAMHDLSRAVEMKEDFALAYHERAGIKRITGDLQGAHYDYQTALEYQPFFPLAYSNMGSVKMLLGDYQGAIEDYTHALEQDPDLAIALNNRGYARYYLGDMEGAFRDFDEAVAMSDSIPVAALNKASLMAKEEKHDLAVKILDEVIVKYPLEPLLYLGRGLIREQMGDLEGACEDWNKVRELGSDEADEYIKECSE
jgi:tetratricopeptide (TPR) repeat protein